MNWFTEHPYLTFILAVSAIIAVVCIVEDICIAISKKTKESSEDENKQR